MPKTQSQIEADGAAYIAEIRKYLKRASEIDQLADIVPIIREAATRALALFEAELARRDS